MADTHKREILQKNIDKLVVRYNQHKLSNNETIVMNQMMKQLQQQKYEMNH